LHGGDEDGKVTAVADDKLSSFKIGDLKRPEVRNYQKASVEADEAPADEGPSAGFPAVEALLEGGTIDSVADTLRASYEQLEEMASSGDMKSKAAAKKSLAAYERTADLFEYLFDTKSALQSPPDEG